MKQIESCKLVSQHILDQIYDNREFISSGSNGCNKNLDLYDRYWDGYGSYDYIRYLEDHMNI